MYHVTQFSMEIRKDNPGYERFFFKGDLHSLEQILKGQPTAEQVWAEIKKIPDEKWRKYPHAKKYLSEWFPPPITLDVPFVTQLEIGAHAVKHQDDVWDDLTGCWYASACMVGYHFEPGPRQGLPELLKVPRPGPRGDFIGHLATGSQGANATLANHNDLLAERENLEPVQNCAAPYLYSYGEINRLLRERGPIFFYWQKAHNGNTYGHASVIIGVDSQGIIYHDPEGQPKARMTLLQFNLQRQKWKYALMQRRGAVRPS